MTPRRRRYAAPLLLLGALTAPALTNPVGAAVAPTAAAASASSRGTDGSSAERRTSRPAARLPILSVSNRPDLISAGDARIAVDVRAVDASATGLTVRVNGRDVSRQFRMRPTGLVEGLVTGLEDGRNVVTAVTRDGRQGRLVLTNHPNGGPVFSGPQSRYYVCQETALDDQCNEPATYSFLYQSSVAGNAGLMPYDPEDPPSDVAMTTTDEGVEVPFIVRLEQGYQARDRYSIAVLWQPDQPWDAFDPQPQFNRKVVITHGGSCGASYAPADAPDVLQTDFLGLGFAVMSTALDNTGHNCSLVAGAESLVMAKERIVEQYGTLRYTIGTGCSGGSVAENTIANAYPGIYQGIFTACTYPDVLSPGTQFFDFHLMRGYFEDPAGWGTVWSPTQMGSVEGHLSHLNAITSDELLFKQALDPETDCPGTVAPVAGDPDTRYDTDTNPTGVRCSALEMGANIFGPRPKRSWIAPEKAAGFGFTGTPFSNIGVQYGLEPLKRGEITVGQFLDLNQKIGGLDVDINPTAERVTGDAAAIRRSYRSGMMNLGQHMESIAIVNAGGPDPGAAHDYAHAFWMERRLQKAQGGETANRVMWFGLVPILGDPTWSVEGVLALDRWLAAVEADGSRRSLADKIAADKPADVTDRCLNVPGLLEVEGTDDEVDCRLTEAQLNLSSPREQAGESDLNDRLTCRLRPLDRSDYDGGLLPMTDAEWSTLQAIFPDGVCDYSKADPYRTRNRTWLTYADAKGKVVHGGRELPRVRAGQASGWSSPAFASQLRQ